MSPSKGHCAPRRGRPRKLLSPDEAAHRWELELAKLERGDRRGTDGRGRPKNRAAHKVVMTDASHEKILNITKLISLELDNEDMLLAEPLAMAIIRYELALQEQANFKHQRGRQGARQKSHMAQLIADIALIHAISLETDNLIEAAITDLNRHTSINDDNDSESPSKSVRLVARALKALEELEVSHHKNGSLRRQAQNAIRHLKTSIN